MTRDTIDPYTDRAGRGRSNPASWVRYAVDTARQYDGEPIPVFDPKRDSVAV